MAKKKGVKKGMYSKTEGKLKGLKLLDISFIKWSTAAWIFFLMTVWPWFHDLILSVHWALWLVIALVFMYRPIKKFWF